MKGEGMMGEARKRGTYEERKAQALKDLEKARDIPTTTPTRRDTQEAIYLSYLLMMSGYYDYKPPYKVSGR